MNPLNAHLRGLLWTLGMASFWWAWFRSPNDFPRLLGLLLGGILIGWTLCDIVLWWPL